MSRSLEAFKMVGVREAKPYAAGERDGRSWPAGINYRVTVKGSDGMVLTVKATADAHKAASAMEMGAEVFCDFELSEFDGQQFFRLAGFRKVPAAK